MTDARAPQQSNQESGTPHHDLPRDAARPAQRTRIREAMNATRMAPVVNDPWADLRTEAAAPATSSRWGAARPVRRQPEPSVMTPLTRQPAGAETQTRADGLGGEPTVSEAIADFADDGAIEPRATATSAVGQPSQTTVEPMVEPTPVMDLRRRPETTENPGQPAVATAHYGLGTTWGSSWAVSTQGWVRAQDGTVIWRPIVTTTQQLDLWDIDRYLGLVTAEVAAAVAGVDNYDLGAVLGKAREIGINGLVAEAVERGAHAIIGVTLSYTPMLPRLIVTMTGTAVTLREKRP